MYGKSRMKLKVCAVCLRLNVACWLDLQEGEGRGDALIEFIYTISALDFAF